LAVVTMAAGAALLATAGVDMPVAYPEGYRSWTHVKSMAIFPGHPLEKPFAGLHHVYANGDAVEGLRSGRYRDGAVLVFDLLAAHQADHALSEGPRQLLGVMVRGEARFAATGGWGFEAFAGDSREKRLVADGGAGCWECHASTKAGVFSEWRQ
jgi:hypothetical protein